MQPEDIDSVVALAFEEYYSASSDFLQALSVDGVNTGGVLGAICKRAGENGSFERSDVDRLVDW